MKKNQNPNQNNPKNPQKQQQKKPPTKTKQTTLPNQKKKKKKTIMEYSTLEGTHKENKQCDKTVSSSKHFLGTKMHSWTNKMQAELPA